MAAGATVEEILTMTRAAPLASFALRRSSRGEVRRSRYDVRLIGFCVVFGLPGFLLGLGLGVVIRQWAALTLIAVGGAVAVRYGVQHFGNNPGDNDPRIIWAIALVANFIGFLVGAATGRLLTRRADPG